MKIKLRRLQLLFSILIFSKISVAQCPPSFSITNYTVNHTQWGITKGDFNSDGNMDFATASPNDSCVSVYYGSSNGTFTTLTTFTSNLLKPIQIEAGDFNGDGKPDLAVTNDGIYSDQLSVLLNSGTGSFGAAVNYSIAPSAFDLVVSDFNFDGKKDLVTTCVSGIQLLLGTGAGTFSPPVIFTTSGFTKFLASNDFNGDGKTDLAVPNSNTVVTIFLSTGTGSFTQAPPLLTPTNSLIHSVDINNDGNQDLLIDVYTVNAFNSTIRTYMGNGAGVFTHNINYSFPVSFISNITAADFNLDGFTDVLITKQGSSDLLYQGNNGMQPTVSVNPNTSLYLRDAVVADFNLDGRPDFAASNSYSPATYASVFLNLLSTPNFSVTLSSTSPSLCAGETATISATGAQTYSWSNNTNNSAIVVSPQATSIYTVIGVSAQCSVTASITQNIIDCTGMSFLADAEQSHLSVFPNPTSDEINITTEGSAIVFISLTNSLGEIVRASDIQKSQEVKLDLNSLKAGLYVVTIKTKENNFLQQKLVIESR